MGGTVGGTVSPLQKALSQRRGADWQNVTSSGDREEVLKPDTGHVGGMVRGAEEGTVSPLQKALSQRRGADWQNVTSLGEPEEALRPDMGHVVGGNGLRIIIPEQMKETGNKEDEDEDSRDSRDSRDEYNEAKTETENGGARGGRMKRHGSSTVVLLGDELDDHDDEEELGKRRSVEWRRENTEDCTNQTGCGTPWLPPEGLRPGSRVEAKCAGWQQYYGGVVALNNGNGTYCIYFDDGEKRYRVKASQIKGKVQTPAHKAANLSLPRRPADRPTVRRSTGHPMEHSPGGSPLQKALSQRRGADWQGVTSSGELEKVLGHDTGHEHKFDVIDIDEGDGSTGTGGGALSAPAKDLQNALVQRRSVEWRGVLTAEQMSEVMRSGPLPDAPQHLPKPTQGLHNGLMQRRSVDWKGELTPEQLSEVMNGKTAAGEVQKSDTLPASANDLRNSLVQKRSDNEAELVKAMEQEEKSNTLPAQSNDLRNALVQKRSDNEAELVRAMGDEIVRAISIDGINSKNGTNAVMGSIQELSSATTSSDGDGGWGRAMEQKERSDTLPAPAKDLRNALVQRRSVEWKAVDEAELMRAMNELENEVEEKRAIVQEGERAATRGETKGGSSLRRIGGAAEGVASLNLEEAIEEFVRTTGSMPTESDIRALLGLGAEEYD